MWQQIKLIFSKRARLEALAQELANTLEHWPGVRAARVSLRGGDEPVVRVKDDQGKLHELDRLSALHELLAPCEDEERRFRILGYALERLSELWVPAEFPAVRGTLSVQLRTSTQIFRPFDERGIPQALSRPYAPQLHVVPVLAGDPLVYVNAAHLSRWGVSAEAVFDAAQANLAAKPFGKLQSVGSGIYALEQGDECAASRVLVPGFSTWLQEQIGGPPVVAIPATGVLLASGIRDMDVLHLARRGYDWWDSVGNNRLSTRLFTVGEDGRPAYFEVAQDHPNFDALDPTFFRFLWMEYDSLQAQLLQGAARRGESLQVADYCGRSPYYDTPRIISHCRWPDEGISLLPVTQFIEFSAPWAIFAVPAEAVRRLVGELMSDVDTDPPLIRVSRPLREAELEPLYAERDPEQDQAPR